jgi:uncharacterized membrane protein YcaP (DUF421 family)
MLDIDWKSIFVPDTPILEIFIRGTLVYLALFVLLRVVFQRQSGNVRMTDLLVMVLIADAAQNAMAGNYQSVPDGLLLVATIVGWAYLLDWLGYQVPLIGRFVHPKPLPLVKDGQMLRHNLRKELITPEELMSQVREQGLESLSEVREAYIEGDGQISFIKREGGEVRNQKRKAVV